MQRGLHKCKMMCVVFITKKIKWKLLSITNNSRNLIIKAWVTAGSGKYLPQILFRSLRLCTDPDTRKCSTGEVTWGNTVLEWMDPSTHKNRFNSLCAGLRTRNNIFYRHKREKKISNFKWESSSAHLCLKRWTILCVCQMSHLWISH